MITMLSGYKTYIVAALTFIGVVAEGLMNGDWNIQLGAIAVLAATLRDAINKETIVKK